MKEMKKILVLLCLLCLFGCEEKIKKISIINDHMIYENETIKFHFELKEMFDLNQYDLKVIYHDFMNEQYITTDTHDIVMEDHGTYFYKVLSNPYGTFVTYELYDKEVTNKPVYRIKKEYQVEISEEQLKQYEHKMIIDNLTCSDIQYQNQVLSFRLQHLLDEILYDNEDIEIMLKVIQNDKVLYEEVMKLNKNGFDILKEINIDINGSFSIQLSNIEYNLSKTFEAF